MLKTLKVHLTQLFGIDIRTLALYRVYLASLLLLDLALRAVYITANYTDAGLLPRGVYLSKFANFHAISFHLASGTYWFQVLLFVLAAIFAIAMLVGYRTTLFTFLSWVMLISLQNRNPDILDGGDVFFRLFLFWAIFLPLGATWSVDRARDNSLTEPKQTILSGATIAIMAQFASIYICAALFKNGTTWKDGTAVYYALHIDHFATPIAKFFLGYPDLLSWLTKATVQFEFYGPIFLFLPLANAQGRCLLILCFIGMHAGFGLCIRLGLFGPIAWCAALVFLPGWFWDTIARRWEAREKHVEVHYHPTNSFASEWTRALFMWLGFQKGERVASSEFGSDARTATWCVRLEEEEEVRTGSDAFLTLLSASPSFFWLGRILSIPPLSWLVAGIILLARFFLLPHLFVFLMKPGPARLRTGFLTGTLAFLLGAYVVVWNIHTVNKMGRHFPRGWSDLIYTLRLDQWWNLFAPNPMRDDGWYVIPATLEDGSRVDLFRKGTPISWKKPNNVANLYDGQRWRKYYLNIWGRNYSNRRLYFGRYLCRWWKTFNPPSRHIRTFKIYYMRENTPPPGGKAQVRKVMLWNHWCKARYSPGGKKNPKNTPKPNLRRHNRKVLRKPPIRGVIGKAKVSNNLERRRPSVLRVVPMRPAPPIQYPIRIIPPRPTPRLFSTPSSRPTSLPFDK